MKNLHNRYRHHQQGKLFVTLGVLASFLVASLFPGHYDLQLMFATLVVNLVWIWS